MGHDSAKMGHDSGKMGILSSTWELLGQFWEHFSRILGDGWESEKHRKTISCLWFLGLVGGSEGVSEASWGLSWTISEHFRTCWREDGEQEGQDGDQEGQHGDQERQDEPT